MSRIDEILSEIDLDEICNQLTSEEKERIMKIINKKMAQNKNKRKRTLKISLIAAAMIVAMTGTVFAMKGYLDKNLSEQLGIPEEQQTEFADAVDMPICSATDNGVSVNVIQTIADTRTLFAVFTVDTPSDIQLSDEYFFDKEIFMPENPEMYSSFGFDIELIDADTQKYMAYIKGTSKNLENGNVQLKLKDLCKYVLDANGNKIRDENGIEATEVVVPGEWNLEWQYNSDIKTNVKEICPNAEVAVFSALGEEAVTVTDITLSPLSLEITYAPNNESYEIENILDTPISIDFKDGSSIQNEDILSDLDASYSADGKGHLYVQYDNIVNVDDIKSITINNSVIPVN